MRTGLWRFDLHRFGSPSWGRPCRWTPKWNSECCWSECKTLELGLWRCRRWVLCRRGPKSKRQSPCWGHPKWGNFEKLCCCSEQTLPRDLRTLWNFWNRFGCHWGWWIISCFEQPMQSWTWVVSSRWGQFECTWDWLCLWIWRDQKWKTHRFLTCKLNTSI